MVTVGSAVGKFLAVPDDGVVFVIGGQNVVVHWAVRGLIEGQDHFSRRWIRWIVHDS